MALVCSFLCPSHPSLQGNAYRGQSLCSPLWVAVFVAIHGLHEFLDKLWESLLDDALPDQTHQLQLISNIMDSHMVHGSCIIAEQRVQESSAIPLTSGAITVLINGAEILGILLVLQLQGAPGD